MVPAEVERAFYDGWTAACLSVTRRIVDEHCDGDDRLSWIARIFLAMTKGMTERMPYERWLAVEAARERLEGGKEVAGAPDPANRS